ncbi:hypothetical protein [Hyphomicrobium sp.]|uniref:hypothetical protein n=1 Tax=Hyphomicrobium sp. TaxID=82 RepID=UPI002D779EA9|nr:hypothetical protein [Hyphomicrobium sp.]HET6389967.1 hypothetical protein [Hyphomicrobium sp.]
MIWIAAMLLGGLSGWFGAGVNAPAAIGILVGLVIAIDVIAANEFTAATAQMLLILIVVIFAVWGASRALRRYLKPAG